ncbi:MAG: glycosyltransferase family 2 protein [Burkholderiales bacterium]|nr:glycosyltransferase family 2 protein [Burkholderiales bacterium]
MTRPFVSIIVPTRDRPELLGYCLRSLVDQSFRDFEVVVSDNFVKAPAKVCSTLSRTTGLGILRHPRPLAMHENWEFAVEHARGTYVAVLIDKTVLRPTALETFHRVLTDMPAELVSWWNEGYNPVVGDHYQRGEYCPASQPRKPMHFDTRTELEERFEMKN